MQKLHSIICTQNSRSVINTFSYRITLPITTYISSIHSKLFFLFYSEKDHISITDIFQEEKKSGLYVHL